MRTILVVAFLVVLYSCTASRLAPLQNSRVVPDEETAKKIAEIIWLPIYGEKIYDEKPFKASLVKNVWRVKGVLHNRGDSTLLMGGTAYIEIRQSDCKILKVFHTK